MNKEAISQTRLSFKLQHVNSISNIVCTAGSILIAYGGLVLASFLTDKVLIYLPSDSTLPNLSVNKTEIFYGIITALISWSIFFVSIFTAILKLQRCLRNRDAESQRSDLSLSRAFEEFIFSDLNRTRILTVIFILIVTVIHITDMIIQPVRIQGHSMEPELQNGQIILVNKISSGIQWPFSGIYPLIYYPEPILYGNLHRGDIVAIDYPGLNLKNQGYMIKRIVALQGDTYRFENGTFVLNDTILVEPYLAKETKTNRRPDIQGLPVLKPPGELKELGSDIVFSALNGVEERGKVPPGSVMVLGDNRRISRDSRSFGFVPVKFIVGWCIY